MRGNDRLPAIVGVFMLETQVYLEHDYAYANRLSAADRSSVRKAIEATSLTLPAFAKSTLLCGVDRVERWFVERTH